MNEAQIAHSNLNVNSQQKYKPKRNIKNALHSNELSIIAQRQNTPKHPKKHQNTAEDIPGEESFSPSPWRVISSVLGATCLLLMAAATVVTILTTKLSSERTSSMIHQKESQHPCPENWVWFRCSCYYFSKEKLIWRESQRACLSRNSSLIRINREEMDFFTLKSFFWVGGYYSEISKRWLYENHSYLPWEMFPYLEINMKGHCASYKSKEIYFAENCTHKLTYICKKQHI
ncbi:killer cell lectin-like receptor subfamily E member 1 [Acomys russatus]|uniref:killer cell lectin-like receptor subfamily E member 1 n=1 Tax=Acomys russatus TaxID=60746 RepID=UPI0021E24481|nr:killer cell lectin-like receptor subfamily E member 1 [Acomys russatus]